jgi:hypothetical protein
MKIIIEPVINERSGAAMRWIRQQVFEYEMGLDLARLGDPEQPDAFHLLMRVEPGGNPAAVLSVVDTSDNHQLHGRYGLSFAPGLRVARYSQLAVLRPYRGMNLPLRLILEAHRRFVMPNRFDYTWLLFDTRRATSSLLHKQLGFTPKILDIPSEYSLTCVLLRDENAARSKQAIRRTERYLKQCQLLSTT